MKSDTGYHLTQGVYWLLLGVWLGAMVMLIFAAVATFTTVEYYDPSIGIEPFDDPSLADAQHDILAGGVVSDMLRWLALIQAVCAAGLSTCVLLQCSKYSDRMSPPAGKANLTRLALIALPVVILAVNVGVISPGAHKNRLVMYDPAQPEAARADAKRAFDRYHALSTRTHFAAALMLAGAVVVSAFVLHPTRRSHS